MIPHRAILAVLLAGLAGAEVIDRVAVTVDNQVITQSDIDREIRLTAFLNNQPPDFSAANRRKTADRMVDQLLIRREMRFTHYPDPEPAEIQEMLKQVKAGRFSGDEDFRAALARYSVAEAQLMDHLKRQVALLHFIDLRFKPEVQVSEGEIRNCYDNQVVPEYEKRNAAPPSYDEARSQCEDTLAGQAADRLAENWLKEARARSQIVYREDAFA